MSYKIKNGSNFSGLTIAGEGFAIFENIRDSADPLMQDRRELGKQPLTDSDYFAALPMESTELLHQKRLHAMVEHAKRQQTKIDIAAEKAHKEAAKVSF